MENKLESKKFFGNHDTSLLSSFDEDRHEEENFCDVIIVVDGKEFKGHRKILAKMSPVFKGMFMTEMKEKYDGLANIKGISVATMESIFNFIYKSEIKIDSKNIYDVLAASDYLQIEELKEICIKYLKNEMDSISCLSVLGNSQIHDANTLRKAKLFLEKNFEKTTDLNEFKEFTKDVVIEIIKMLDSKEVQSAWIYDALVSWVYFDVDQRKEHFTDLLKDLVEFKNLSTKFLKKVVINEPLLGEIYQQITVALIEKIEENDQIALLQKVRTEDKLFVVVNEDGLCKLFHLLNKVWETLPKINLFCTGSCFVLYKTKIFGFGSGSDNRDVLMLDLSENEKVWKVVSKTNKPRVNASAVLSQDMIYITGGGTYGSLCGTSDPPTEKSCEIFDPVSYSNLNIASFNKPHTNHICIEFSQGVPLCLSYTSKKWEYYITAEYLDREMCLWKNPDFMDLYSNHERPTFAAVMHENQVILLQTDKNFWYNKVYNLLERKWSDFPKLNKKYDTIGTCNLSGKIIVFGRYENSSVFCVEEYVPKQKAWEVVYQKDLSFENNTIYAL